MKLDDLLRETLSVDCDDVWENERTPTPVRVFGVRLHSMGLSLREVVAVFKWLDVDRSHGAVWNWTHTLSKAQDDPPTAEPSRVVVDETQIEVDGEKKWLYAAIDTNSKLLLEIDVPAANVGIILSGSASKRQYAQRLGRILRPTDERQPARLYELIAMDTMESYVSQRRREGVAAGA